MGDVRRHGAPHWLQLVSLANSSLSASNQSIASVVQKEVAAQLRNSGVDRSRTPRGIESKSGGRGNKRLQLTRPQQLTLLGPSAPKASPESKGKARGKGKKAGPGKRPATSSKEVRRIRNCSTRTKVTLFAMRFKKAAVKTVPSCTRKHVCLGCGGVRGYIHCQCLQSRLAALP